MTDYSPIDLKESDAQSLSKNATLPPPPAADWDIIIWKGKYALDALERAQSNMMPDPELSKFYKAIHKRSLDEYTKDSCPYPFSKNVDFHKDQALIQPLDNLCLSIVVTSRNDTHVERMGERTQAFIDGIYHLAEKHRIFVELIIVEWNPPDMRQPLVEEFLFTKNCDFVSTRIITVPKKIHDRYDWANSLPLYQMIAKNVGIKRARGQFILATNIDILLSDKLFLEITSKDIKSGRIYRSNRWDIDRKILDIKTPEERLEQAAGLTFQINYREGIYPVGSNPAATIQRPNVKADVKVFENWNICYAHTEACGDFQMLHRNDWQKIRGYSEIDAYSFHIDSLLALTCHHADLAEHVFDDTCPHYHIDHTLGIKKKSDTYEINEKSSIRHLTLSAIFILDKMQAKENDFCILNDENWGLSNETLPESQPKIAKMDAGTQYLSQQNLSQQSLYIAPSSFLSLGNLDKMLAGIDTKRYFDEIWDETARYVLKKSAQRAIYIWGAGHRGLHAAHRLISKGITLSSFIHSGTNDPVNLTPPLPILSLDHFQTLNVGSVFVIIASSFANDILPLLENQGWVEGKDFIISV